MTIFSQTTWFVRALSIGILSMSVYDDAECTTHFYNGKMKITSADSSTNLTGTRCNDNLYYLDSHRIERALAFAKSVFAHTLPLFLNLKVTLLEPALLKMKTVKHQLPCQKLLMKVINLKRVRMLN